MFPAEMLQFYMLQTLQLPSFDVYVLTPEESVTDVTLHSLK